MSTNSSVVVSIALGLSLIVGSSGCLSLTSFEEVGNERLARGRELRSEGDDAKAESYFRRAGSVFRLAQIDEPDSVRLRLLEAETLIEIRDFDRARKSIESADELVIDDLSASVEHADVHRVLGRLLVEQSKQPGLSDSERNAHRENAASEYWHCREGDRWNVECALGLHRLLLEKGQLAEANDVLQSSSLLVAPDLIRAIALLNAGDNYSASRALAKISDVVPDSTTLMSLYCYALLEAELARGRRTSSRWARSCEGQLPQDWQDDLLRLYSVARFRRGLDPTGHVPEFARAAEAEIRMDPLLARLAQDASYGKVLSVLLDELEKQVADRAARSADPAIAMQPDTEPPRIEISKDPIDSFTESPQVLVRGVVSDNVGLAEVRVGDEPARLERQAKADGEGEVADFAAMVSLKAGSNRIVVSATDLAGQRTEVEIMREYQGASREGRWAFFIEVARYEDPLIPERRGVGAAAERLRRWLSLPIPEQQARVVQNGDARREFVLKALADWVQRANDAGVQEFMLSLDTWATDDYDESGEIRLLFLPYDAVLEGLAGTSIDLGTILEVLSRSNAERILILLNLERASRRLAVYQPELDKLQDRLVLIAAAHGVQDSPIDPSEPRPWHFLTEGAVVLEQRMHSSEARFEERRTLTLIEWFRSTHRRVLNQSRHRQVPYFIGRDEVAEEWVLIDEDPPRATSISLLDNLLLEGAMSTSSYGEAGSRVLLAEPRPWTPKELKQIRAYVEGESRGDELFERLYE